MTPQAITDGVQLLTLRSAQVTHLSTVIKCRHDHARCLAGYGSSAIGGLAIYGGSKIHNPQCSLHHSKVVCGLIYSYTNVFHGESHPSRKICFRFLSYFNFVKIPPDRSVLFSPSQYLPHLYGGVVSLQGYGFSNPHPKAFFRFFHQRLSQKYY